MMFSGWQFKLTGWPWRWVLPVVAVGVWALTLLVRKELAALPLGTRRLLLALRGGALALVLLLLLEPILSRRTSENVLPLVAVVVDQSGSMAVKDESMAPGAKLAEAIGLDLLPSSVRPLTTNAAEQAASDARIVSSAAQGSAVAKALDSLSSLSRYERAVRVARQKVAPLLEGKARVKFVAMDTGVTPLELDKPATLLPNRATDFEACLSALARTWAQDYFGGVVLLTDGRQTAGADPLPVVRSLRARGALVTGLMVGDPGLPPDAAVAEISGSSEVFLGEHVPLTVRYRIVGADDLDWDMVVTCAGKEMERRTLRGNGQWQYATFAFAATNAGMNLYQARLELARDQATTYRGLETSSVNLEVWNNVGGSQVSDLVNSPAFRSPPSSTTALSQLAYENRGAQYGARIRGLLLPPLSGNYTFWISSDDASELWVSPSLSPREKVKVASVPGFVPRGTWEAQPSQKSQPVTLKARQPCYFEVLYKQGTGEDHLAVRWRLPDGAMEQPIPSTRLATFNEQTPARLERERQSAAQRLTNSWKEASLANNTAECSVAVNQDPIRVLLVDSTPRWESRYLAAMFERDRRVNLTRRYHSVIIEDRNLALLPKNQAEWNTYDMVCLGDLDSAELPPAQQGFLANFVARRGGFLVCLAGPRGLPKAFSLGALANVLPVRVTLSSSRETEPVTVALTPEGVEHPVTQILNDSGLNQKMWPLLPPLQWVADSVVVKPGATALLCAQNPAKTPIVAVQRYGAGRVFWVGTEESWRWRDRLGERVHQTFWLQVMRWGLAGRLRGADQRLQAGLDRYLMTTAESAELKARACNQAGEPLPDPPVVKIEKLSERGEVVPDSVRNVEMLPVPEAPGIWHLAVSGLEEGSWRLVTSHRAPELKGLAETRELCVRDQSGLEGLELGGDLPGLTRMANAGGHFAGSLGQADQLLKDYAARLKPRRQEHRETLRLWNGYFSLMLITGMLCAEWVLRKRKGLP